MAKDDIGGVWRTISGRRVFIKDGQDLATAMKESGKFDNLRGSYKLDKLKKDENSKFKKLKKIGPLTDDNKEEIEKARKELVSSYRARKDYEKAMNEEEKSAKMNETMDRRQAIIERLDKETKDLSSYDRYNLAVSKLENEDYSSATERQYWAGIVEKYKKDNDFHYAGEELYSDDPNRFGDKMRKYNEKMNPTKNEASKYYSKLSEKEIKEDLEERKNRLDNDYYDEKDKEKYQKFYEDGKKYYKEKYGDQFVEGANRENKFKTGDKVIYNGNEVEIYQTHKDPRYGNEYLVRGDEGNVWVTDNSLEKISTGNDYLPKEKKVETAGTSNRKEVSDNIQAHILDYYDNPVDFMEQMDAMDWLPTRWHAGQELAKGGSYLIYNGDMADFLDSLNINPKGKKFSEDKSFQMYTSLIGRESERLYNRLEKLFDQYKKEHKNSNATLDDFRKWFK